jgi:hypothetical protein
MVLNIQTYVFIRYVSQEVKYTNGIPDAKFATESKDMIIQEKYPYAYEEQAYDNGYLDRPDKKTVLKIKME